MTTNEITMFFTAMTDNFALVSRQPSNKDINLIVLAVMPLLHDIDYNMYSPHNLVDLIKPTTTYSVIWGAPLICLACPMPYNLTIANNAMPAMPNWMEAAHNLLLLDYATFTATKKGTSKFICDSVDKTYYKDLESPTTFYNGFHYLDNKYTNNEAEYRGIITGLQCAWTFGIQKNVV